LQTKREKRLAAADSEGLKQEEGKPVPQTSARTEKASPKRSFPVNPARKPKRVSPVWEKEKDKK